MLHATYTLRPTPCTLNRYSGTGTQEILREIRTVREFAMEDEEAEKFAVASNYRAEIEEYGR